MNEEQEDLNFDVRFPARRKLVWFLVISFSLVALVFGAYQIENWRGRSAWKKYQREQEAKGETFDIRKLAPPAVPDASNFASVPMFAKLFDYYRDSSGKNVWRDTNAVNEDVFRIYRTYTQTKPPDLGNWILGQKIDLSEWQAHYRKTRFEASELNVKSEQVIPFPVRDQIGTPEEDVLLALSKHDDALTELREASARPFSCYPIRYEDNVSTLLPHLMRLGAASQFLALRACAELRAGQRENAADDIILNLRAANSLSGEPLMMSQSIRIAMVSHALQPLWEGLGEKLWSDGQLVSFNKELQRFDFLESLQLSIRGERSSSKLITKLLRTNRNQMVESLLGSNSSWFNGHANQRFKSMGYRIIPDGWFYQNQLRISFLYDLALKTTDSASRRCFPLRLRELKSAEEKLYEGFVPYKMLASFIFPEMDGYIPKSAFEQTAVNQALLACALECYRLANGVFPESLAELAPRFLDKIPHDIMNGESLKYRRTADGQFVIYSIGWNEIDDGGIVVMSSSENPRMKEGDWVWQYTTNSPAAKQASK